MKTAFKQIRVIHCAVVKANHARGLYGFHDSPSCPDCQKIDDGFRVHDGDSIFAPFVGYYPDAQTVISPDPIYVTH
jgi:hypothetical protein